MAKVDTLEKNAKVYKGVCTYLVCVPTWCMICAHCFYDNYCLTPGIAEKARSFLIGVKELTIAHRSEAHQHHFDTQCFSVLYTYLPHFVHTCIRAVHT